MHFHENQSKKEMFAIEVCCVLTFLSRLWTRNSKTASKATKKSKAQAWFEREQTKFYDNRVNMKYWLSFKFDLKALVTPFPLNFKFHNIVFNQMLHDII